MTAVNPQAATSAPNGVAGSLARRSRPYPAEDVARLRGSVQIEYSLARLGAEKFWRLLHSEQVIGAWAA